MNDVAARALRQNSALQLDPGPAMQTVDLSRTTLRELNHAGAGFLRVAAALLLSLLLLVLRRLLAPRVPSPSAPRPGWTRRASR